MKAFNKKIIDKIFELAIFVKSIFGVFEILVGTVLVFSGKLIANNIIIALTQQEISEDPKDLIANYVTHAASDFATGSHIFAITYLIFHGAANIFLAISLLKNKIWAYLWALSGFTLFIIYQIFRYSYTHSALLLFLTIFDIFIVFVVLAEYRNKKNKLTATK